ncbi:DsbA family oxidoreductase [Arthrobacter mangrovi]|uniref:DSBA oxidoreductase n=1 Tax=Arthrobacter mangrovi TaxID=2966350 RepID=A0ABQ5N0B8_9MICC|nr:DsbA family oxidoreductase [Arthrobacter mangrovi]GLB69437.1 DSBA oxidoreductase [Arthrobacter mangrovi]
MKVEIWSDVACPWCFIGKRRFESALENFEHKDEVEVQWRSYQLDPTLPQHYDGTETEYLSEIKGMPQQQVRQMFEHVTAQAAGEGLSYDFDKIVVANSFMAHRFMHLAKEHGRMDAAKEALLSGHFEHGEDIGDIDYLVRTGVVLGLDEPEVREALAGDKYSAEVRADIAEARALGVNGVPFFVLDRKYGISGAQPAEVFGRALQQAWGERSPLTVLPGNANDGATCGPEGCN